LVSIHNREYEIVAINDLYKRRLGERTGSKSWELYLQTPDTKERSPVIKTFKTGRGQRSKEILIDIQGREMPVVVHTAPIRNKDKEVELVLEISADLVEVNRLQEELRASQERYQQLFDAVPCYISVHDRDLKLVGTNKRFKEDFGESANAYCYEVYKHRNNPVWCPVVKTFEAGISPAVRNSGHVKSGDAQRAHLDRSTQIFPEEITQVMEVSTDITQIRKRRPLASWSRSRRRLAWDQGTAGWFGRIHLLARFRA
jgi:PAS domain-containing protein